MLRAPAPRASALRTLAVVGNPVVITLVSHTSVSKPRRGDRTCARGRGATDAPMDVSIQARTGTGPPTTGLGRGPAP
eukprot:10354369-Alexandrium_andersonii.AAC.1